MKGPAAGTAGVVASAAGAQAAAGGQARPVNEAAGAPGPDVASTAADSTLTLPTGSYRLVFSDEFAGKELDTSRWCTRLAWTGGSALELTSEQRDRVCTGPDLSRGTGDHLKNEAQRYVLKNTQAEAAHVVSDGTLKLRATKTGRDASAPYESGLIRSKLSFVPSKTASYYLTARVRIPNVKGTFAAMWLQAGFGDDGQLAWPPEIDVFEAALNEKEDKANMVRIGAHVSVDGPQTATGAEDFVHYTDRFDPKFCNYNSEHSLREVWLQFSALWTADQVCYYVNDENVMCENYRWLTSMGSAANPAQLILDLAIGDDWAGRYGIDDSKFPTALEVDYVRVYSSN